jgi:hypothetical protein
MTLDGKSVTTVRFGMKCAGLKYWNFPGKYLRRHPSTPYAQEFKIINTNREALNGSATLKQIAFSLNAENKLLVINFALFTPNNVSKPVPVFLADQSGGNIRKRKTLLI